MSRGGSVRFLLVVKIMIFVLMMLMDKPFDEHQSLMMLRWCWARACRSDRLQSDIMSARSSAYPWMDSASKEFSKNKRSSTSRLNRNGESIPPCGLPFRISRVVE